MLKRLAAIMHVQSISTQYVSGTGTVSVPTDMTSVTIECYGGGSEGNYSIRRSGGGGAYSQKTAYSTAGLTALYYSVAASGSHAASFVKANTSGGTVLCYAYGGSGETGGAAADGTGDIKYSGGNGIVGATKAGGGGAGPDGNGGDAVNNTPGAAGGGSASAGATANASGSAAGGGGGSDDNDSGQCGGGRGEVVLSWA